MQTNSFLIGRAQLKEIRRESMRLGLIFSCCFLMQGCLSSLPYHVDMYSGKVERDVYAMSRQWLFTWGSMESAQGNNFQLFLPVTLGAMVVDTVLFPIDATVMMAFPSPKREIVLTQERQAYRLYGSPFQRTGVMRLFCAEGARLFSIRVTQGEVKLSGVYSQGGMPEDFFGGLHVSPSTLTFSNSELTVTYDDLPGHQKNFLSYSPGTTLLFYVAPEDEAYIWPWSTGDWDCQENYSLCINEESLLPENMSIEEAWEETIDVKGYRRGMRGVLFLEKGGEERYTFPAGSSVYFKTSEDFVGEIKDLGLVADWWDRL